MFEELRPARRRGLSLWLGLVPKGGVSWGRDGRSQAETGGRPGGNLRRRRPSLVRWTWALVLLLGLQSWSQAPAQSAKPVLHVFVQVDAKSAALEKILQQQLPGLSITVFSRYRDLEDASVTAKPDGLLAITPVLQQRGKKPSLQGIRGGKDQEPWVLVSVGNPLDHSLSGKTIGAVDVLGHDGTQAFIADLLRTRDVKVKRVAKSEDLLSLLEFNAADGVIMPSSSLARLTERTQLAIKSREVPGGPVGLPAVAVFNDGSRDAIIRAFVGLDSATKKLLGIEAWSVR